MQPKEIMKKEYGTSINPLSPHIIEYGELFEGVAYELSTGHCVRSHRTLYGVTFAMLTKGIPLNAIDSETVRLVYVSHSFGSEGRARRYIDYLQEKMTKDDCEHYVKMRDELEQHEREANGDKSQQQYEEIRKTYEKYAEDFLEVETDEEDS